MRKTSKHLPIKATSPKRSNAYDYGFVCSILKDLRVRASLTKAELSEKSGFSESTIAKIESAQDGEVRISTLIILLDALGYDLEIRKRIAQKESK